MTITWDTIWDTIGGFTPVIPVIPVRSYSHNPIFTSSFCANPCALPITENVIFQIVALKVAGSSPVSRPTRNPLNPNGFRGIFVGFWLRKLTGWDTVLGYNRAEEAVRDAVQRCDAAVETQEIEE